MLEQRTKSWHDIRLGKVTASRFGDLLTESRSKTGEMSATARDYLLEKITEMMTGESRELSSDAMDWGTEHEDEARRRYELKTLTEVVRVGFIQHPELPSVGCSPDGLIGEEGGLEIKCPYNPANHVRYWIGAPIPTAYYAQCQGGMWVTGRKWWDFVSFDARVADRDKQLYIKRIYRDEVFINKLSAKVDEFLKALVSAQKLLWTDIT